MFKKTALFFIIAAVATFSVQGEENVPSFESGVTVGAYYTVFDAPETDDAGEALATALNFFTGLRGGGSFYAGYRFNDFVIAGADLGFYYFSEEAALFDIPLRAYAKLGFESFNLQVLGGVVFRNGIGYANNTAVTAFEAGLDFGGRLNMGGFYIEASKVVPLGDALPGGMKYGLGLTFDLDLL